MIIFTLTLYFISFFKKIVIILYVYLHILLGPSKKIDFL
jgi:hypothetical protein